MHRWFRFLFVTLLACALFLPACDRFSGGGDDKKKEEKEEKEEKEQEQEAEDEEEEESADYSKEDFVKASADLACVDEKVGDKVEDMEKVKTDILGEYGFDSDSFSEAEEEWSDDDEVKSKIDERLGECTKEDAMKLAGMEEKKKEEKKKKPDPKPAKTGSFSATVSGQGGFDNASLTINITEDFEAYGQFKGQREGKGFRVSFEGDVSKKDRIEASGSEGKNSVNVVGSILSDGPTLKVSGKIWERDFELSMKPR